MRSTRSTRSMHSTISIRSEAMGRILRARPDQFDPSSSLQSSIHRLIEVDN